MIKNILKIYKLKKKLTDSKICIIYSYLYVQFLYFRKKN